MWVEGDGAWFVPYALQHSTGLTPATPPPELPHRGAATSKDSGRTSSGGSCTQPRPADDALQPFCFIPTVSKEAQAVLEERRVQPVRPLRDQPLSVVTKFQADYDARTAPVSEAAAKQHLQVRATAYMAALTARCVRRTAQGSIRSRPLCLIHIHKAVL